MEESRQDSAAISGEILENIINLSENNNNEENNNNHEENNNNHEENCNNNNNNILINNGNDDVKRKENQKTGDLLSPEQYPSVYLSVYQ